MATPETHIETSAAPACHGAEAAPSMPRLAASTTLHCLTGCVIGETIGVMLGVSLGWQPLVIAAVATLLAFISGFALTLIPMFRAGQSLGAAFRLVWLGEVISISTMEVVMNVVDYMAGGMTAGSILSLQFWGAMAAAIVAGYAAGYPVNYFMLSRGIKERCH